MAPLFVLSEHYRSADKSGVREYSGGKAASVSLRIFFWLRQKLRCVASRPSVDGKMLAIEPRVRCGAHIPKRNAIHLDGISFWSRIRESNPPPRLGKPMYYRCTNPAYEVFIAVLCTADTGVLRQLRCLRVPAHFLLAVPKAAMLRIAAVLRRQNACDRTRLPRLGGYGVLPMNEPCIVCFVIIPSAAENCNRFLSQDFRLPARARKWHISYFAMLLHKK